MCEIHLYATGRMILWDLVLMAELIYASHNGTVCVDSSSRSYQFTSPLFTNSWLTMMAYQRELVVSGGYIGGSLVSWNPWLVAGISWEQDNPMITIYKLTLEMWIVHLAFSKFKDHLLHGFLYHFNANTLTVPRKRCSVVLMVSFVNNFLIIFL